METTPSAGCTQGCTKTRNGEISGKWGNAEMGKWGMEEKSVAAGGGVP